MKGCSASWEAGRRSVQPATCRRARSHPPMVAAAIGERSRKSFRTKVTRSIGNLGVTVIPRMVEIHIISQFPIPVPADLYALMAVATSW